MRQVERKVSGQVQRGTAIPSRLEARDAASNVEEDGAFVESKPSPRYLVTV